MAINQAYPSLGGIEPSWADIAVTFTVTGGTAFTMADIAALKWSRKLEVGKKRGASGGRVISRTTGQSDYEATASLYRTAVDSILNGLTTQAIAQNFVRGNQVLISLVAFDILVQHTTPGSSQIFTTKLKGCRYLGDSDDMKEGVDPDKVEITLDPVEIARLINGREVVLI